MYSLIQLGWNEYFENQFHIYKEQNFIPARVAAENKQRYILFSEYGELTGEVTGKLLYSSETVSSLPKIGDWVATVIFEEEQKAIIHSVMERKTKFSRKTADRKTEEQIIAANIDYVFIVQSLDNNFNIRRLERYLTTAYESRVQPIIILNKTDLNNNPEKMKTIVEENFLNADVILTNSLKGDGIDKIKNILKEGCTAVFVGSSGVGKSTIINSLAGEELLRTDNISFSVKKGKHITTRREMLLIPGGVIVIDTPGMRELQLWDAEEGLNDLFSEIELLALDCKFSNCNHTNEEGCAVKEALEKGIIKESKFKGYLKLRKELDYLEGRNDKNAILKRKDREKRISKEIKNIYKRRNR